MLNVNNDYSVQNDESLHCANDRRVRKRCKKVRRDVI